MKNNNDFQNDLLERLKDSEYAASYIEAAIEENDANFLQIALGDVVKAHGVSKISEITGIARQALYRMISRDGNPTIKNLNRLLDSVGLEIDVKAKSA
ncbi:MAG: putative addiction module antidote protein [Bacteriovoracaceae bacterium]|nr:putative addiction module antidote protein [Bacteriovoracaceae bacterium]